MKIWALNMSRVTHCQSKLCVDLISTQNFYLRRHNEQMAESLESCQVDLKIHSF